MHKTNENIFLRLKSYLNMNFTALQKQYIQIQLITYHGVPPHWYLHMTNDSFALEKKFADLKQYLHIVNLVNKYCIDGHSELNSRKSFGK